MKKIIVHKIGFVAVFVIFCLGKMFAVQEHFYNSIHGVHFAADSSITVKDDKFMTPLWHTIQDNLRATDEVSFQFNEDTNLYLTASGIWSVDLMVTWTDSTGHRDSVAKTLTIRYDTNRGKSFNFRSTFKFSGGYALTSRILMVQLNGIPVSSYPAVFTLEEDIYIDRIYKFDCPMPIVPYGTIDYVNQKALVLWPPVAGADEYDLEWTFYDSLSNIIQTHWLSPSVSDFDFLFRNNATRVTVPGNSYSFAMVFNPGYVFLRVRPVHYDSVGHRIEGTWSSELSSSMSLSVFSLVSGLHYWGGHEDSLNWQYTAAYAEEGKRKEVASYFDGTLRNRQSVTINNSEKKAIIGENIYDFQGRVGVTTLPVPVDSDKIVYYNNFNLDPLGYEYNRTDFDTGGCGFYPPPMDSTRGSSQYYSSSNPDVTSGFNSFIPDAQGYPFTMTEYTPDNTGRISKQNIAGKTHRFGSDRETKYYYGKPAQEQLDRLFGNEVGDSSHYLEDMVIDPNGQISVSYIDANGKTIATALAGNPPPNLDSILSYHPATPLTINLLDGNTNHPTNTSVLSTFDLLATNSGRYFFAYKLFPGNYLDPLCTRGSICDDCLYDVSLSLTPLCGNDTVLKRDTNFTYATAFPFDTLCRRHNILDTFSVYLTPGQYNITRTIQMDGGALNFYTDQFMRKDTCKTYQDFLSNALANTDFAGCSVNCATCLASIGADTTFLRKFITQIILAGGAPAHQDTINADTAYNQALAECNQLCQTCNLCSSLYNIMISDMTVGGQYADFTTLMNGHDTTTDPTSIFYSPAYLYRHPVTPYVNEAGVRDSVLINSMEFAPEQLSVTDYINHYNPSWAKSLVTDHPEYCYYMFCQLDSASNRYDQQIENTFSFSSALIQGFINPLGDIHEPYTINSKDPFFQTGGQGVLLRLPLMSKMKTYIVFNSGADTLSIWQTAAMLMHCSMDTLTDSSCTHCYPPPVFGTGCPGDNNLEWDIFRGLYLSLKQHIQDSLENVYVTTHGCNPYADCIGQAGCGNYTSKQPRNITFAYAEATRNFMPNGNSLDSAKAFYNRDITAMCDSQCTSYAYTWIQELKGCLIDTMTSADSILLVKRLVAVCEAGCNATHPLGSSTTADNLPDSYGDRTFEDAIKGVLHASPSDILCDSLDISLPTPYIDSSGITGPPITWYKPDSCICKKLDTLLIHYYRPDSLSHDPLYINFADYLNKKFGGHLADSTVYTLMDLCHDRGCFFTPYPVNLPLWMTCCSDTAFAHRINVYDSAHTHIIWDTIVAITQGCCIKCADIDIGMRIFMNEFPERIDTALYNNQTLVENFLNNLYGYNLTFNQYIAFYDSCSIIHCSVTRSGPYFPADFHGAVGYTVDSTCGGVTIIDTITAMETNKGKIGAYYLWSRNVLGNFKSDSIPPTLCNDVYSTPIADSLKPDTNNCITQLMMDAQYNATNAYNLYRDSLQTAFQNGYIKHCMNINDSFHATIPFDEYHYTLYYYDQAENLVKTIPPQGVHPITSPALLTDITNYRSGTFLFPIYPTDSLSSRYWFNTINSPLQQATPDGDTTRFWYDRLGRLALSQNAVQKPYNFSYTEYDPLGRIIEVGQLSTYISYDSITFSHHAGHLPPLRHGYLDTITRNDSALNFWIRVSNHTQVTHTYYDSVAFPHIPLQQINLRKRISTITYADFGYHGAVADTIKDTVGLLVIYTIPKDTNLYNNAIHYTYDIEGNVTTQLTDVPADSAVRQRFKRTDYYYDLISGKVNELIYQHDSTDQFMQAYEYDADNRITDVLTSHDSLYWEEDANYQYYWHGPLAREELGRRQVQGLDYAYTLNGWIKGVNSSIAVPSYDMGGDGDVHGPNATVGRDAYGFTLNYFNGDYRPIGNSYMEATGLPITSLYNGNVTGAAYSIKHLKPSTIGWVYEYDQLNRYRGQTTWIHPDRLLDNWSTGHTSPAAEEKVNYDENGNILTYIRHGNTTVGPDAMDSLNYYYNKGTNQLNWVHDTVPATNYPDDIDNQTPGNYKYNAIGELAKDDSGRIDTIIWNVYGKVQEIAKSTATQSIGIFFKYDPLGNRIKKITAITPISHCFTCVVAPPVYDTTDYARDAQGNILAVYNRTKDTVKLSEWDLYGSKRLGTLDTNLRVYPPIATTYTTVMDSSTISYLEGQKQYELTNHLGNVLATINDRKLSVDTNHDGHTDYYLSNTISAGDYYPFGMPIPGRRFQLLADSCYRFGFNGKMFDKDIYGDKGSYDYGMRMYNPRLGKFLSVDPLTLKYPHYSPYMFAGDKPTWAVDLDGLEDSTATIVFTPLPQPQPHFHSADYQAKYSPLWVWAEFADAVNNTLIGPLIDAANKIKDPNTSTVDKVVTGVDAAFYLGTMFGGEDPMESEHLDNPNGAKTGSAVEKQNSGTTENANAQQQATTHPNPYGSPGKPDHQAGTASAVKDLNKEVKPGEKVLSNKRVQGLNSNRRPDAQIVNKNGVTRKIIEVERKPRSARNIKREKEYDKLGVPHETRPIKGTNNQQ